MQRLLSGIAVGLFVASSAFVHAQKTVELKTGGGGSPHVRTEWTIDGANISIEYGRPFLKGRPEAQMMPPGQRMAHRRRRGDDHHVGQAAQVRRRSAGARQLHDQHGSWRKGMAAGARPPRANPASGAFRIRRSWRSAARRWRSARRKRLSRTSRSRSTTRPAGATLRVEWGTASATVPFTVG